MPTQKGEGANTRLRLERSANFHSTGRLTCTQNYMITVTECTGGLFFEKLTSDEFLDVYPSDAFLA